MKEGLYRIKRNIQKKIRSTRFKFKNDRYAVAFRLNSRTPLYGDDPSDEGFILIKNSLRYWLADPFLFEYNGKNYLFAEMYDKRRSKGTLGYAVLKGERCGRFRKCLERDFHLSYPCVFRHGSDIFLLPEAKGSGKATLYKSVGFPKKWVECRTVCYKPCVDTTPAFTDGKECYFTTVANERSTDDNLYLIDGETGEATELQSGDLRLRSAGCVIEDGGRSIRPSQDDTVYGDAVIFNRIDDPDPASYKETAYRRILPPGKARETDELSVKLRNNERSIAFDGLHTYNVNKDYEVIDLRYPRLKMII